MKSNTMRLSGLALAAATLLAGCGGGGNATADDPAGPGPTGLLRKVSGADELESSIKDGFTTVVAAQSPDLAMGGGAAVTENYSRTYTQEQEVDEFDSVKYDGEFLFVAPMRGTIPCCFIADQPLAGSTPLPPADRSIRIFETDPASGGVTAAGRIPLPQDVSVQGMYRSGNRLVAMTSTAWYGHFGEAWSNLAIWAPARSGLNVYDTSDIGNPTLEFEATFDGMFIDSRRVGDTVYVISRYTPDIPGLNYFVTTAAQQAANQAILNDVSLAELLPQMTINGVSRSLVDPANCYVPSDEKPAYPVITSVTAVPVSNPEAFTTTCYNDEAYGSYVSPEALYVAQSRDLGAATRLHKFGLTGTTTTYAGSVDIDGIAWTGGQADFRLSEKDGLLRVFTSTFENTATDFVDHFLYVLREAADAPALEVVSQLPNANRPGEIGKPNEALYGVRFLDDRAYAVTFERIDPLYVFDLSDPADPRVAGTLEVTGFSELLHPVNDALLLGLGRSDSNAVKLELYDVSDLAQPLSLGADVLGGPGSFSEATYNRHAFTYLADVNGVDRFTFPADLTAADGSFNLVESGLYLYEIRDKALPNLAAMMPVGKVIVRGAGGAAPNYSTRSRSVLHDDALFYVRDDEVYSTMWTNPTVVDGPH